MIAENTFDYILSQVQNSSLNFQLQLSPFSAYISLKKSLVKDKLGKPLLPRLNSQELELKYDSLKRDYNAVCQTIQNFNDVKESLPTLIEVTTDNADTVESEIKKMDDEKIKDLENLFRE